MLKRTGLLYPALMPVLTVMLLLLWFVRDIPAASVTSADAAEETEGADLWDSERELGCGENRNGCLLLQMVMMGSFEDLDAQDALTKRVFAMVYPQLASVPDEDWDHFLEEFHEDGDTVRERYNKALALCLYCYIDSENGSVGSPDDAQRVLLLFLDASGEENAEEEKRVIREQMTDAVLEKIAQAVKAPVPFVRWLIYDR